MRMEELSDSRYVKSTDQVERYLLGLVEEYCKNSNVSSPSSREYIIKRAVQRMKEEISFEGIGVLSVTLPDGEQRTGAVNITLEDLNGEPLISPKLSAFNVSFGNEQNTACEGNDPRLSDARKPLKHQHEIKDIIGLEGQLSTLEGLLNRTGQFEHEHTNKNILDMLVYTGDKTVIDLTLLDTIKDDIQKLVDKIREEIIAHKQEINNKITEVNTKITEVKQEIENLKQFIIDKNEEYYKKSTDYTDTKITETENALNQKIDKLVTKEMLNGILDIANKAYTFVGQSVYTINSVIDNNTQSINQSILDEIIARGTSLDKCVFDISLKYLSSDGQIFVYTLPYLIFKDNTVCGMIQVELLNDGTAVFHTDVDIDNLPDEIYHGEIIINVYSTSSVSI